MEDTTSRNSLVVRVGMDDHQGKRPITHLIQSGMVDLVGVAALDPGNKRPGWFRAASELWASRLPKSRLLASGVGSVSSHRYALEVESWKLRTVGIAHQLAIGRFVEKGSATQNCGIAARGALAKEVIEI